MDARSPRGADTRLRLVEAAVSLIGTSGWAAATSRAVADAAGVNSALVHYHFGSIEQLRRDALVHATTTEAGRAVEAIIGAPDVLAGVVAGMRVLAEHPGEVSEGERVIVEGMVQAMRDDELRALFAEALGAIREMIAVRIAEAQEAGLVRADIDARELAVGLAGLIDGLMLHLYIQPEVPVVQAMAAVSELARTSPTRGGRAARKKASPTTRRRSGGS